MRERKACQEGAVFVLKAAEQSFREWDNEDDQVYNSHLMLSGSAMHGHASIRRSPFAAADRVAEFLRRINPQLHCFIDVLQRGLLDCRHVPYIQAVLVLRQ